MVPREHVPPTVYGPTPADPDELEREANELVADIQRMSMADPRELNDGNEYMHTPESLAAWKAQEGGGNG